MAAPTIQQIMQGIETRLKTITSLRTAPYVADQVNPPQAYVGIPAITYHKAFAHGNMAIDPIVTVLIGKVVDRSGQQALAAYMDIAGTNSIHAAIEADRTLGLAGVDCIVTDSKEADITFGALTWYGAVFTLKVLAKGA